MKYFGIVATIVALLTAWEAVTPCPGLAVVKTTADHHAHHGVDSDAVSDGKVPLSLIAQCPCGCDASVDESAHSAMYLASLATARTAEPEAFDRHPWATPAKWSAPSEEIEPIPI